MPNVRPWVLLLRLATLLLTSKSDVSGAIPHTNNGAEAYHSHLNAEFYVKHPNIYMFVDVLKKVQQTAYVAMNSLSQPARISEDERDRRQFAVTAL